MTIKDAKSLKYGDCVRHAGRMGKVEAHVGNQLVIKWSDGTSSHGSDKLVWMIDCA